MKFNIIYADPPWSFKTYSNKGKQKSAEKYYKTLNIEDIKKIDVQSIAEDNCILFLWVTFPFLIEGLEVIKDWGFIYKTVGFCWVKRYPKQTNKYFWGLGYYTRANAELCLIATKGKIKRVSNSVHQIIDTPIEKHSKKPDIVREKIVELVGNLPRVELFAREKVDGWVCLGNEIDGLDINEAIKKIKNID